METARSRQDRVKITQRWKIMLTIKEIKEQLPDVKIRVNGKVETGKVRGRALQYAVVFVGDNSWEYSWEAMQRAVNKNRILEV